MANNAPEGSWEYEDWVGRCGDRVVGRASERGKPCDFPPIFTAINDCKLSLPWMDGSVDSGHTVFQYVGYRKPH